MPLKIAPVRWFLGQTVLPEHLRALQSRGDHVTEVRHRFGGRPSHGIAELAFSEPLLDDGTLSIVSLTAVLPDGQLVAVPANAVVSPLSLKATSATELPVYFHLTDEELGKEGIRTYDSDPRVVERVLHRAYLSISDKHDRAVGSLKLGIFRREANGRWVLSPSYLPPLLQITSTPYFQGLLSDLETRITNLEPQMVGQLQDTFLRPERLQAMRRLLALLYETLATLLDLKHQTPLHPYDLFVLLRRLLFELCTFHEVVPDPSPLPYRHDDLAQSFSWLVSELGRHLRPVYTRSTHLRFVKSNGLFSLGSLPQEVKDSQEVYLLIQRSTLHDKIDLSEVKLSCTSRLALIHRLVLRGVPFRHVERPPFQHTFGPEVDFHFLQPGEEWNHVLRESSISFYVHPTLEKANAFLFWR